MKSFLSVVVFFILVSCMLIEPKDATSSPHVRIEIQNQRIDLKVTGSAQNNTQEIPFMRDKNFVVFGSINQFLNDSNWEKFSIIVERKAGGEKRAIPIRCTLTGSKPLQLYRIADVKDALPADSVIVAVENEKIILYGNSVMGTSAQSEFKFQLSDGTEFTMMVIVVFEWFERKCKFYIQ